MINYDDDGSALPGVLSNVLLGAGVGSERCLKSNGGGKVLLRNLSSNNLKGGFKAEAFRWEEGNLEGVTNPVPHPHLHKTSDRTPVPGPSNPDQMTRTYLFVLVLS